MKMGRSGITATGTHSGSLIFIEELDHDEILNPVVELPAVFL
jgi:hypothetical protein